MVGLLAAVGLGIALTLQVRSWTVTFVEAGGSCGTSKGVSHGPCPRGTAPLLVLSLISLFFLVPLVGFLVSRSLKSGEPAGRVFGVVMVVAVAAGVYPGLAVFDWAHGKTLAAVWEAPSERGGGIESADGSWVSGSTVIRARFDGLTAYDVPTGHLLWALPIPGSQVLCLMSRHTGGDIGLVGFGAESKPCDQIMAVDLRTGRPLWQQARPGTGLPSSGSASPDTVDVVGQMAVLGTAEEITGADLRTGAKRWSKKPEASTCRFNWVGGGVDQLLTRVDCARQAPRVRALDAVTGRQRWESPVLSEAEAVRVSLVSASPAVVLVQEGGKRGIDSLLFLDGTGQVQAKIRTNEPERTFDTSPGFRSVPLRKMVIGNGVFVATTRFAGGHYSVLGFDLVDGHRLWSANLGSDVDAMQVDGERLLVVTGSGARPELRVFSLRTGRRQGGTAVLGLNRMSSPTAMYVQGDHYVFVNEKGYAPWYHPLGVTKRAG